MTRIIRKSMVQASREVAHLLESVFAIELLAPSRCLWIVSPWVSDVPVVDNTTGDFAPLADMGWRPVPLAELLAHLAGRGTHVVVGISDDPINDPFLASLGRAFSGSTDRLDIRIRPVSELHEKAIVTDDAVISGSMNFTFRGVFVRDELVELHTAPEVVARFRADFYDSYGGTL